MGTGLCIARTYKGNWSNHYNPITAAYFPGHPGNDNQSAAERPVYTPNLRHLEIFHLLMKTRNLTETARLMHVTQPAVSQALRDFEAQLGLKLFNRGGGRIRPTQAALTILPDIERLFSHVGTLKFRVAELQDSLGGQISIAASPILSVHSMPGVISEMLAERPRLNVSLQSMATTELVELVRSETVDLGFTFGPIIEIGVAVEPLFETRLSCVLARDHPLASREAIGIDDLNEHRLVVLSPSSPSGLVVRDLFQRAGTNPAQIETNSAAAAVEIVRQIGSMALVDPMPILEHETSWAVIRPFEPSITMSALVVYSRHRALPKIAMKCIAHSRTVFQRHAEKLTALGIPSRVL